MRTLNLIFSHALTILSPVLAVGAIFAGAYIAIRDRDTNNIKDSFIIAGMMLILPLIVYVLLIIHFLQKKKLMKNHREGGVSQSDFREALTYYAFIDIFTIGNFHIIKYFQNDQEVYAEIKATINSTRDALHEMSKGTNTKIRSTSQLGDM